MSIFGKSEPVETPEGLRGIPDAKLLTLTNEQLLCVALSIFMEAQGVWDEPLIKELRRRGSE